MTTLAWASACGAVPSLARDAQARRARLDELNAALAVAKARQIDAADQQHQRMLANARANAADYARDRERARAKT
jgi:hypothetical protein